jgi:hypothetical protein
VGVCAQVGERCAGYGCSIDLVSAARDEVVGLHEFFVGWFTGVLEDADVVFARFADAVHVEFSMVVPSGEMLDRDAVVASVRAAHATVGDSFGIEIRDVVDRVVGDDLVLVTYEEWQLVGDRVDNRRVSTVLFVRAPTSPNGVQWRHLHETFREI